jgi:RNA polymerase sigma-70 factor (ECF subfamily)
VWGRRGSDAASDDGVLLAASANGDRAAFARLAGRHYDAAYRAAWRMTGGHADCEDMVQEAFLALWKNPAQVREPRALRAWLLRAVTNRAIDRARAKPMPALDAIAEPMAPADRALPRREVANTVDKAVAALPDRQRQALVLVYFEELSNIDAAQAMEVSVEALESLLARARRGLKTRLAGEHDALFDNLHELDG